MSIEYCGFEIHMLMVLICWYCIVDRHFVFLLVFKLSGTKFLMNVETDLVSKMRMPIFWLKKKRRGWICRSSFVMLYFVCFGLIFLSIS